MELLALAVWAASERPTDLPPLDWQAVYVDQRPDQTGEQPFVREVAWVHQEGMLRRIWGARELVPA